MDGKVAVITGGSRHLGYDMADILAEAGCDLVITSRTAENAEEAAKKLRKQHGRDVLPYALDVRQFDEVDAFAQKVLLSDELVKRSRPHAHGQRLDAVECCPALLTEQVHDRPC